MMFNSKVYETSKHALPNFQFILQLVHWNKYCLEKQSFLVKRLFHDPQPKRIPVMTFLHIIYTELLADQINQKCTRMFSEI